MKASETFSFERYQSFSILIYKETVMQPYCLTKNVLPQNTHATINISGITLISCEFFLCLFTYVSSVQQIAVMPLR